MSIHHLIYLLIVRRVECQRDKSPYARARAREACGHKAERKALAQRIDIHGLLRQLGPHTLYERTAEDKALIAAWERYRTARHGTFKVPRGRPRKRAVV
jgi:hypothetical protein